MGYLVEHPDGLLMDTGMGTHPEVDAYCRSRRRSLPTALGVSFHLCKDSGLDAGSLRRLGEDLA